MSTALRSKIASGFKWTFSLEDPSLENILWHFRKLIFCYGMKIEEDFSKQEIHYPTIFFTVLVYIINSTGLLYNYLVAEDRLESISALSIFCADCDPYLKRLWFFYYRKELVELVFTAFQHNKTITAIERKALHIEMTTAKWRCRLYFVMLSVNTVLYCFWVPGIFHGRLPGFPIRFPGLGDPYSTPHYYIIYFGNLFLPLFMTEMVIAFGVLFAALMGHFTGHIRALIAELGDLAEKCNEGTSDNTEERLRYIARRHIEMKDFMNRMAYLLTRVLGLDAVNLLFSTLVTFQAFSMHTVSILVHTVSLVFLYCYFGECLLTAGEDLEEAVYTCSWEKMEQKDSKTILMVLKNAQTPLQLTAVMVFNLSHNTFVEFMRILYSIAAASLTINSQNIDLFN